MVEAYDCCQRRPSLRRRRELSAKLPCMPSSRIPCLSSHRRNAAGATDGFAQASQSAGWDCPYLHYTRSMGPRAASPEGPAAGDFAYWCTVCVCVAWWPLDLMPGLPAGAPGDDQDNTACPKLAFMLLLTPGSCTNLGKGCDLLGVFCWTAEWSSRMQGRAQTEKLASLRRNAEIVLEAIGMTGTAENELVPGLTGSWLTSCGARNCSRLRARFRTGNRGCSSPCAPNDKRSAIGPRNAPITTATARRRSRHRLIGHPVVIHGRAERPSKAGAARL